MPALTKTATWKTLFTTKFAPSCRLPIMGPPMIGVSGGLWAAAIQRAGGLGFIAAGHLLPQQDDALRQEIALYRKAMQGQQDNHNDDSRSLALGLIGHSATAANTQAWERYEHLLTTERPAVVQFFAPAVTHHPQQEHVTNISLAQYYGAKVMAQVGNVQAAQQALDAGVDALIVQGSEAGGHGLRSPLGRSLIPLLMDVQDVVRQGGQDETVPVLAAGGITTGAGAAAALCAGADGVVLGTRLWASRQALGPDTYKQALVNAASCDDVIRTTVLDQIQNSYVSYPWPQPYDSLSVLHNDVTRKWHGRTDELAHALQGTNSPAETYARACQEGNVAQGAVLTGQGVGQIHSIDSVEDILSRVEQEMLESMQALSDKVVQVSGK